MYSVDVKQILLVCMLANKSNQDVCCETGFLSSLLIFFNYNLILHTGIQIIYKKSDKEKECVYITILTYLFHYYYFFLSFYAYILVHRCAII